MCIIVVLVGCSSGNECVTSSGRGDDDCAIGGDGFGTRFRGNCDM